MKWALIIGGVAVAGFIAYKYAKPYLTAFQNLGGVAGDVRGITSGANSTIHSISNIFSDVSRVTSSVSNLYDDIGDN